ncbi:MAG: D-aminoacyl-tRNA deacylase [Deltaproteobacteria bacterium]|nr:D-aminoacyl-tRNA deacylase [Deltaproteobacteria bacterium]
MFDDVSAHAQRSVAEVGGSLLAVSQFTLLADCRKGRRPSYDEALPAGAALPLFLRFVDELRAFLDRVETGSFDAEMHVRLVNAGPFTLILDSRAPRGSSGPAD